MFGNKHTVFDKSTRIIDSEQNLVVSSAASIPQRTMHYLNKRGKAVGRHVLAQLNLVDPSAKDGKRNLRRSATSRTDQDVRSGVFCERYVSVRLLGQGGNGTVHLCRDTKVGSLVAVKTIHHDEPLSTPNEVHILHLLGYHQNIVQYHTMLNHPTLDFHVQLIFEYCPISNTCTRTTLYTETSSHVTSSLRLLAMAISTRYLELLTSEQHRLALLIISHMVIFVLWDISLQKQSIVTARRLTCGLSDVWSMRWLLVVYRCRRSSLQR